MMKNFLSAKEVEKLMAATGALNLCAASKTFELIIMTTAKKSCTSKH
jgi:hypothetical protein